MKDEISKEIRGKMLSKESTEQIVEDIAIGYYKWMAGNSSEEYGEFVRKYLEEHGENGVPLKVAFNWYLENIFKTEQ